MIHSYGMGRRVSLATNSNTPSSSHIVYTYTDLNKYFENAMIYIAEGIDKNQTVFFIDQPEHFDVIHENLQKDGYSEDQVKEVIFFDANKLYGKNEFSPEYTNQKIKQLFKQYFKDDRMNRLWTVMTWEPPQAEGDLLSRLSVHEKNYDALSIEQHNLMSVCVYDGTTMPVSYLNDILRDHDYHMTDTQIAPSHLYKRNPVQFFSMSEQIKLERKALDKDIRAERLSTAGDMAANVAHEIRNPIAVAKGFLQLVERTDDWDKISRYHNTISNELMKIERIASEFLALARPVEEEKKDTDIPELIQDIAALMEPQAVQKSIHLHTEVSHQAITINCDEMKIKQAIANFIKNAIEAMGSGNITIRLRNYEEEANIQIIDDGPGMTDETLNQLDKPFVTSKKDGTGLGILISEKIIEEHNGTLVVDSEVGKGTIFTISLPK